MLQRADKLSKYEKGIRLIRRSVGKRAISLLVASCICFCYISKPESVIRVDAAESDDELHYYEWEGISDIVGTFNQAKNTRIRTMVTWSKDGIARYVYGDDHTSVHWNGGTAFSSDRQVNEGEKYMFTDNGRGAPYFVCNNSLDKDNDYYPQVTIYMGRTAGREITDSAGNKFMSFNADGITSTRVTADDDDLEFKWSEHNNAGGVQWTVEKRGQYSTTCDTAGVNIFQNVSGRDPVWKKEEWGLNCEYQTTESKRHWFYLYKGREVRFKRYPAGIRCQGGQVTALKEPSVLPENSITYIYPGSVLSINNKTFLNGKIVVDGGTLVIQKNATLMSYSRLPAVNGSGSIEVKNGGAVVIMDKARLAIGRLNPTSSSFQEAGQLTLTSGGKLYNFGMAMVNRLVMNTSAEIENRPTGVIYAGYQFTDVGSSRFYFDKSWKTNETRFAPAGVGGAMVSADSGSLKSMTGENLRVINKGAVYLSSKVNSGCGFGGLIEGNAPVYTRAGITGYETFN